MAPYSPDPAIDAMRIHEDAPTPVRARTAHRAPGREPIVHVQLVEGQGRDRLLGGLAGALARQMAREIFATRAAAPLVTSQNSAACDG